MTTLTCILYEKQDIKDDTWLFEDGNEFNEHHCYMVLWRNVLNRF